MPLEFLFVHFTLALPCIFPALLQDLHTLHVTWYVTTLFLKQPFHMHRPSTFDFALQLHFSSMKSCDLMGSKSQNFLAKLSKCLDFADTVDAVVI